MANLVVRAAKKFWGSSSTGRENIAKLTAEMSSRLKSGEFDIGCVYCRNPSRPLKRIGPKVNRHKCRVCERAFKGPKHPF